MPAELWIRMITYIYIYIDIHLTSLLKTSSLGDKNLIQVHELMLINKGIRSINACVCANCHLTSLLKTRRITCSLVKKKNITLACILNLEPLFYQLAWYSGLNAQCWRRIWLMLVYYLVSNYKKHKLFLMVDTKRMKEFIIVTNRL